MNRKYYIGIDGGSSRSTVLLIDENLNEIRRIKKGPTNPFSIGMEKTEEVLRQAIREATENPENGTCGGICIGSAGIHRKKDAAELKKRLEDYFGGINIHVTNDYEIALVGGTGSLNGIILISGTGSVAYGRSEKYGFVRAGGWGHLIGDEGSAYHIGRQALVSIFETDDENGKESLLKKLILENRNCSDLDDLMFWAYKTATKKDIADLALVVDKAGSTGDITARRILYDAADDLLRILRNIRSRLLFNTDKIPMIISGGVLLNNTIVRNRFLEGVKSYFSDIYLVTPKHDAAFGAALLAVNFASRTGE